MMTETKDVTLQGGSTETIPPDAKEAPSVSVTSPTTAGSSSRPAPGPHHS
jgi:hypothetical protein